MSSGPLLAAWRAGDGTSYWCPSMGSQLRRHLPNGRAAACWPSWIRLWRVPKRHEVARNVFAFMPSKLGVYKPEAQLLYHQRQMRHGVAVLPDCPQGPYPAALLRAKMLGIYPLYPSAGWSRHSLQCALKTSCRGIPYMWLCWASPVY